LTLKAGGVSKEEKKDVLLGTLQNVVIERATVRHQGSWRRSSVLRYEWCHLRK
jgi:hypothetical protein